MTWTAAWSALEPLSPSPHPVAAPPLALGRLWPGGLVPLRTGATRHAQRVCSSESWVDLEGKQAHQSWGKGRPSAYRERLWRMAQAPLLPNTPTGPVPPATQV